MEHGPRRRTIDPVASPAPLRPLAARSGPLRWLPLCALVALSLVSLLCEPADLRGHGERPPTARSR